MAIAYQNYRVERVNDRLRMFGDIYDDEELVATLGPDGIDFNNWFNSQPDDVQRDIALAAGLEFVLPMLIPADRV